MQKYVLLHEGCAIGIVRVEKIGCYYRVNCRFILKDSDCVHLSVKCGKKVLDLGLCVRYGDQLGTERLIPVHCIGEGKMQFYLNQPELFVPISTTEPFKFIDKLVCSRFAIRSGIRGIEINHSAT